MKKWILLIVLMAFSIVPFIFLSCEDDSPQTVMIDGEEATVVEFEDDQGQIKRGYFRSTLLWDVDSGRTDASTDITTISVCWTNPEDWNEDERALVRNAVENSWAAISRIEFEGWNQCDRHSNWSDIRIRIANSGAWSYVGTVSIDSTAINTSGDLIFEQHSMSLNLSRSEVRIRGAAIHEFGHALGMLHEQAREDNCPANIRNLSHNRDSSGNLESCVDNDGNEHWICGDFQDDDYTEEPYVHHSGNITEGSFDNDSIMSYCYAEYLTNPQLSQTDIKTIQKMYDCNPAPFDTSNELRSCITCPDGSGCNK